MIWKFSFEIIQATKNMDSVAAPLTFDSSFFLVEFPDTSLSAANRVHSGNGGIDVISA